METVPVVELTPEFIIAVAAALISIVVSYFPKLNVWFASKPEAVKQGIMAGAMVIVTAVVFGLGCLQWIGINNFACDQVTAVRVAWSLFYAVTINQGIHRLSPKTKEVRAVVP